ncbi:hypothetical protein GmHk_14G040835 [Glycine max]|nr:hypothetical protein GmHk_14G040835 [Glycine max]
MPIKPDLKWPKEAWILGQDVSVGFTSTMYTVLFPHFWLPLCALLHTTASHPLPIAAIYFLAGEVKKKIEWPKEAWILGQDVFVGFTPTMYTVLFPHFWLPLCALLYTTAYHPLPIAAICNFSNCIGIPKIPLDHQRKIQLKKRLKLKLLKRKRMADFLAKNGEEEKAQ